ncbi:MAG: PASTA domain-containing protein [Jatrophihabitans sp.]
MSRDPWRCTDIVEVPHIVGLHIRDAERAAYTAGLKLAQPDPDGPPLAALTWPDDYWITEQEPAAGSRRWRWDSLVVHWSAHPDEDGVREPRRPTPPLHTLAGQIDDQDQHGEPENR